MDHSGPFLGVWGLHSLFDRQRLVRRCVRRDVCRCCRREYESRRVVWDVGDRRQSGDVLGVFQYLVRWLHGPRAMVDLLYWLNDDGFDNR